MSAPADPRADLRKTIAAALLAMADVLERVEGAGPEAHRALDRARSGAYVLAEMRPTDLDRADQVKTSLQAVVDALDRLASQRREPEAADWAATAANTTAAISAELPLGLQRAPVQDALRAVADAIVWLWEAARRGR